MWYYYGSVDRGGWLLPAEWLLDEKTLRNIPGIEQALAKLVVWCGVVVVWGVVLRERVERIIGGIMVVLRG